MTTAPHAARPTDTTPDPGVRDCGYGDEFRHVYDRIFRKDAYADLTGRVLAGWHPDPAAGTLELGVGTGRVAVPLARELIRVATADRPGGTGDPEAPAGAGDLPEIVGVDSSLTMLEGLRTEIDRHRLPITPVHGDIRVEREDDRRYGLVYCVCATLSMLTHPDEQRAVIRAAARALAPGGVLVVETAHPGHVRALHDGRRDASFFTPYPEPNTGLLTCSTLLPGDQPLWRASHVWFEGDGTSRVGTEISRLTEPEEVDAYAAQAGLVPIDRWADWLGNPLAPDSPMYIARYAHADHDTEAGERDGDA
ncbi:methyltransferase domain-containing protein [Streptomyces alkaliphilus]|uniref:Methyltransferase domain-containing protein n=1 Tax=Streptomyces alkaliphilus TaxID=1472722 RepID=A0A7W3TIF0_9ACTN|nr:class I SAM-dependent methyltransferase [Streptomyces alkaliphilus]MBB0247065.1 methyltransferase domain-containing protein [Streptomyces alkaliphilus]